MLHPPLCLDNIQNDCEDRHTFFFTTTNLAWNDNEEFKPFSQIELEIRGLSLSKNETELLDSILIKINLQTPGIIFFWYSQPEKILFYSIIMFKSYLNALT